MNVSFNGIRLNLARHFNDFAKELELVANDDNIVPDCFRYKLETLIDKFEELRRDIWVLMCINDDNSDSRDLSDEVSLKSIELDNKDD